jgi:hypothetical protein
MNDKAKRTLRAVEDSVIATDQAIYAEETERLRAERQTAVDVRSNPFIGRAPLAPAHPTRLSAGLRHWEQGGMTARDLGAFAHECIAGFEHAHANAARVTPQAGATSDLTVRVDCVNEDCCADSAYVR